MEINQETKSPPKAKNFVVSQKLYDQYLEYMKDLGIDTDRVVPNLAKSYKAPLLNFDDFSKVMKSHDSSTRDKWVSKFQKGYKEASKKGQELLRRAFLTRSEGELLKNANFPITMPKIDGLTPSTIKNFDLTPIFSTTENKTTTITNEELLERSQTIDMGTIANPKTKETMGKKISLKKRSQNTWSVVRDDGHYLGKDLSYKHEDQLSSHSQEFIDNFSFENLTLAAIYAELDKKLQLGELQREEILSSKISIEREQELLNVNFSEQEFKDSLFAKITNFDGGPVLDELVKDVHAIDLLLQNRPSTSSNRYEVQFSKANNTWQIRCGSCNTNSPYLFRDLEVGFPPEKPKKLDHKFSYNFVSPKEAFDYLWRYKRALIIKHHQLSTNTKRKS